MLAVQDPMSVFRHDLSVTEFSGKRFDLALDFLQSGRGFVVSEIKVSLEEGTLRAYVPSSWQSEKVTKATAMEDLSRGRALLTSLRDMSQRFNEIADATKSEVWLIDDYGTGWVKICEMVNEEIVWEEGLPC